MEKAYKFRIYPTKDQEVLIRKTFGCARYIYNRFLSSRKDAYESDGITLNYTASTMAI